MPGLASERAVRVQGLRELQRAFRLVGKDLSNDLRSTLREVAEPVRAEAEQRALQEIENIGPRWSQMRVGVTQNFIYVAPKERGRASRRNDRIRRPGLKPLLLERAMDPALDAQASDIERRFGDALDDLADRWERV